MIASGPALAPPMEDEDLEGSEQWEAADTDDPFWAAGERPGLHLLRQLMPQDAPPGEFLELVVSEIVPLAVALVTRGATEGARYLEEMALELALEG